ncbi:MAG: sodium-translocating pyrophosphatase, partial [Clostridia bacterium]|nr:sodium-translocating pyrophosphatase [Clostridia bacterium]
VGDNVGDVAGMGADLYESYVGSLVSSMALSYAAFKAADGTIGMKYLLLPMLLAGIGILASIIGTFFVRTSENLDQRHLLKALRRGTISSGVLFAAGAFPALYLVLGSENNYLGFYLAIIVGLIAGILIGTFTEYMTSDTYKPTKALAAKSETGVATVIIGGLSLGLISVAGPIIIVAAAIIAAYLLPGGGSYGLLGIALAAVGMLSTLGITLATDAYGPVADNAGGIAQMAGKPEFVRERTDALDSLGNTTAATGKGFAIGSAALTALALVVSYKEDLMTAIKGLKETDLIFNLTDPCVLVGLFIGAMLPYVFSAMTMNSVGAAAQKVVVEVRRQFKEIPGLLEGKAKADYRSCVDICAKSALRNMILPALIAVLSPVVVSLLLGYTGIVGMLVGATASGFLLAIMMSNSGGAWDNAKKYVESGHHGGKNSEGHKATVVGDTVGDPLKDTSGPSINILIKLLSVVSITVIELAGIGVLQNLMK